MHTQLFYWAAQILHRVFDIPIWIPTLHLVDDVDDEILDHFYVSGIFLLSLVVMGMLLLMRDVMDGASTPAVIFSILGPRPSMPVAFVGFSPRMNSITC